MTAFRGDGIGWTSVALIVFGGIIVVMNAMDVFSAIPMVFGLVVLACGLAVALAGVSSRDEADE